MWVVTEILIEPIIKQRVKIINKFIKIAQYCLDIGNFNTFFSIIGGLEYNLISRLKTTWELLPQKATKLFNALKLYCDPANNMSRYREWLIKYSLTKNRGRDSLIPLLPLLKKDLTFINDSSKTLSSNNQV
ncbi:hypothetical protein MXB_721 [Myxobolus squamalis]|nr:hypothetical protein MXB_721 [Myxobolus squamalis]